jgi:hypothetical protein
MLAEFASQIDWHEVAPLVAFLAFVGGIVIVIVSLISRSIRRTQIQVDLKRDMVARGMSADEICRVLKA